MGLGFFFMLFFFFVYYPVPFGVHVCSNTLSLSLQETDRSEWGGVGGMTVFV